MNVLAVGAHPDDVELGCGGTIGLLSRRKHRITILILTRGECTGNPQDHERQCLSSAKVLGVDNVFFGNLQDTMITDGRTSIDVIENFVNKVKPAIVLGHSSKDRHQDHRNAALATMSAARNVRIVLQYESPAALREFCPQVFADVTLTFDVKMKALAEFGNRAFNVCDKGASSSSSDYVRRVSNAIEGLARYRGYQSGTDLAEAFEVGKFLLDLTNPAI